MNTHFYTYLFGINLLAGALFTYDKRAAKGHRRRISERMLHLFELGGGVFSILLLMYILHHKNRKFNYYSLTYLVAVIWLYLLFAQFL